MRRLAEPFTRFALFVIFFWFGFLKVAGHSPAAELVAATLPFLPSRAFVITLGVWEMAIGVLFLIPALTWGAVALMLPQMAGTFLPLVLLPDQIYEVFPWALTLPGQYIVKNLALLASASWLVAQRARVLRA